MAGRVFSAARPRHGLTILLISMILMPGAAGAQAAAGIDVLRDFLESVQSMRAGFYQELLDDQERLIEEASGSIRLQRPGKFRWNYDQPYERIIVADGERVWMYDPDLEQVTVRDLDTSLGNTPAALLTGDVDVLDNFTLEQAEELDGVYWLSLLPVMRDSDFERIALGFDGPQLVRLELEDKLGQTTRVEFTDIELNPVLPSDEFEFDIPDGADVIDESAI